MYFRRKKSPSGIVLQLLESYRDIEGKPCNQVVVSLGDAKIPEKLWNVISKSVERHLYGDQELIPLEITANDRKWIDSILKRVQREGRWSPAARKSRKNKPQEKNKSAMSDETIDGVLINRVSHTHTTSLGPTLLGLTVWETLGMPQFLSSLGFNKKQCDSAAVTVVNRLVEPVTENFLQENWLPNSAMPDLLGETILKGTKDRFYGVSDKLLRYQGAIEHHLREAQASHFNLTRTLVLYDLTNTHFEGECKSNPKAKHGKNKQKRNDCCQVVVGMVLDEFGFELGHKTFEGNLNDSKSLVEMIELLGNISSEDENLASTIKPLIIVDAGVATKENLKRLHTEGYNYLVNDSRRKRSAYRDAFNDNRGFTKIPDRFKNGKEKSPVKVKIIEETLTEKKVAEEPHSDRSSPMNEHETIRKEHLVLCKSDARRNKELAIVSNAEKRFLQQLEELSERIDKGRLKDTVKIERAIGRIRAKHTRASCFYQVTLVTKHPSDPSSKSVQKNPENKKKTPDSAAVKLILKWQRDDQRYNDSHDLLGCYVLRTDRLDLTAEQYWQLYIGLTYAEDGFRELKTNLGLRPNHHRVEWRVDGHIFISILAYHLLRHILYTLRLTGDNRAWPTIRQVLETHCYTTIMIPTVSGQLYRLRKPGKPEECQQQIYDQFEISIKGLPTSKIVVNQSSIL
jgi:transposase